jgi:hypothetical protein
MWLLMAIMCSSINLIMMPPPSFSLPIIFALIEFSLKFRILPPAPLPSLLLILDHRLQVLSPSAATSAVAASSAVLITGPTLR